MTTSRSISRGLLGAVLALSFVPLVSTASDEDNKDLTELDPFSVSAIYAAIEVEFILSGEKLFNPLEDPVIEAEVRSVQRRDPLDVPAIAIGNKIVAINGTELRGKNIPQIATLLTEARAQGIPVLGVRQGALTKQIKFDGDWLVPMPGLKR
ncbi:MAG: hypothetical protein RIS54_1657 [Verrucomicrobiota bacterium]|jgi:hypothetical protein